jgi:hypothetical protein
MAKIAKPDNKGVPPRFDTKGAPPKFDTKGAPPKLMEQSHNLTKAESSKMVLINFNATAEFRKEVKIYATEIGLTVTELIMEAIELHKKARK